MNQPVRPLPMAQGTLQKRPLAHLLAYTHERKLTGSLVFGDPDAPAGAVVLRMGAPIKAEARGVPDTWQGLASLPADTAFAYFDDFDALHDIGERPLGALAAVLGVLRLRAPSEHMKQVLARVGEAEVTLKADVDVNGLLPAEAQALLRLRNAPFSIGTLRTDAVLAMDADMTFYGLLITRVATLVEAGVEVPPAADSSQRMVAAEPASDSQVPPAASSSSDDVGKSAGDNEPDSSQRPGGAAVARVKLTRTTKPQLKEERARVASFDGRASIPAIPAAEVTSRRREILELAATIDSKNYFQMLGVDESTPPDQVENAFLALAKRWHPDRLPAELADARDACARVFARLNEARATLTNDEQRKRYKRLFDEGGATPEDQEKIVAVLEAATAFQKAEVMLKRGDLVKAREFCSEAVQRDTQADYVALLAWIDAQDANAQSPDDMRRFEAQLSQAIQKNERCERAYFYRGNLRKKLNDISGAVADFRKAFELNPRNLDAQREVRLHEMRGARDSKPPQKSSLIDRLFKK